LKKKNKEENSATVAIIILSNKINRGGGSVVVVATGWLKSECFVAAHLSLSFLIRSLYFLFYYHH